MARCNKEFANASAIIGSYVGLSTMAMPNTLRHCSGIEIKVQEFTDVEAIWQVFLRRIYDVHPEDRVSVDAGANIGSFSLYASWIAPQSQILAIEPFPSTFERLKAHVNANGLSKRIRVLDRALASVPGEVVMAPNDVVGNQGNYIVKDGAAPAVPVSRVKSVPLVEAIEGLPEQIDLLKMDIEGSEYDVLLNLPVETLRRFRRVNVEHHEPIESKKKLVAHFTKAGYTVTQHAGDDDSVWGILRCQQN